MSAANGTTERTRKAFEQAYGVHWPVAVELPPPEETTSMVIADPQPLPAKHIAANEALAHSLLLVAFGIALGYGAAVLTVVINNRF